MRSLPIYVAAALLLLSWQASAADTAAPATDKSATAAQTSYQDKSFDKYWSKIDPTGKGYTTKAEWMAHAEQRFKEVDTNGDGKVSKEEMRADREKMLARYKEMSARRKEMNSQEEKK